MTARRRTVLAATALGVVLIALALVAVRRAGGPSAQDVVTRYVTGTTGDVTALRQTTLAGRESPDAAADVLLRTTHSPRRGSPITVDSVLEDTAEGVGADSRLFVVTGTSAGRPFTARVRATRHDDTGWLVVAEVPPPSAP